MPHQNGVTEARGESLDLSFDSSRHVDRRPARHMAVGPDNVLAVRRARGAEQRRLRQENKRALRMLSESHFAFRGGHFLERATHMHCSGTAAQLSRPGNRLGERVIDFENARSVSEALEPMAIGSWKLITGDAQQL